MATCAEEVMLKHLLWTSLESWGRVSQELGSTEFSLLDADQLEAVMAQYARTASKIEKGLSPNQVSLAAHAKPCCLLCYAVARNCCDIQWKFISRGIRVGCSDGLKGCADPLPPLPQFAISSLGCPTLPACYLTGSLWCLCLPAEYAMACL